MRKFDFLVVGAGIVGLAIARELKSRFPDASIAVLEKEASIGKHSSGRNSGVMHSGIYYPPESLKAKVCVAGKRAMEAYCDEHKLPISRPGKVIVPLRSDDNAQLDLLLSRAHANGAKAEMIDAARLKELEPDAYSITGKALWVPETAVIESKDILEHLARELADRGVTLLFNQRFERVSDQVVQTQSESIAFGHLFNAAGLFADEVAQAFGIGKHYAMLPFKGLYWKLSPDAPLHIQRMIYPVPDLNVPFLGVHFTKKVDGSVYLGPTAIPAFGRENYAGLAGIDPTEVGPLIGRLLGQYWRNKQGFRAYAHAESLRFFKSRFAAAARALVPGLETRHLLASDKVGIRAQLLNLEKGELVMDFLVERTERSTHVLNAVSPAFTSAFAFAKLVLDDTRL